MLENPILKRPIINVLCRVARTPLHLIGLTNNDWWNQIGIHLNLSILEYGLKFIPSTQYVTQDIIKIQNFFTKFKSSSSSSSSSHNSLLNSKVNAIIEAAKPTIRRRSNISTTQRLTLDTLRQNDTIVIKNADKNLGITIMDDCWYHKQVFTHLNLYKRVRTFPHHEIAAKVQFFLKKKNFNLFKEEFSAPCNFYIIPKVHKVPISSRPISVASRYITSPLSKELCSVLNGILNTKENIISSSLEFLRKLPIKGTLINHSSVKIFTADVEALYPSIDIAHSIELLTPLLKAHNLTNHFIEACRVVLYNHYVTFLQQIYHQTTGIAMGTSMAPPWASLYMLMLESDTIAKFPELLWYLRYIDDYVGFWNGSEERFNDFTREMNELHPNIKIKFTNLATQAAFLDIFVYNFKDHWVTKLYRKDLNRYLYIPYRSEHTRECLRGWVKAELIRICRASSTFESWLIDKKFFRNCLRSRGYPHEWCSIIFKSVVFSNRPHYLTKKIFSEESSKIVKPRTIVLRYNPRIDTKQLRETIKFNSPDKARIAWSYNSNIKKLLFNRKAQSNRLSAKIIERPVHRNIQNT